MTGEEASTTPRAGRRPGRRRFVVILLALTLGLLLAGEGAARLLPPPRHRLPFAPDPVLGARPRPGWSGGHVRFNELGLRDDAPVSTEPAGERRILVIGDSMAYASELPFEATFGERLEQLLGPGVRCLNASVPGYSTVQERNRLEELAPTLRPEVVLLVVSLGTDISELCEFPDGPMGARRRRLEVTGPEQTLTAIDVPAEVQRLRWSDAFAEVSVLWRRLQNSALYQRLKRSGHRTRGRGADGQPLPLDAETYRRRKVGALASLRPGVTERAPLAEGWARFEAELALIRAAVDAVGAELLVIGVPEDLQVDGALLRDVAALAEPPVAPGALDLEQPQRRGAAACERVGATWLDLLPPLRAAPPDPPLYVDGNGHLTAAGHEVLAREVARALRERL